MAKRAVLAAGAIERPIVFGGNDRPGITMAAAVRTYANRFAAAVGREVLVFTNNNDGWRTARDLRANGITVAALVDARSAVPDAVAADFDGRVLPGATLIGTKGGCGVRAALVQTTRGRQTIACDAIAVSGGWNPNIGLACHHGSRPKWEEEIAAFVPDSAPKGMTVVGAANGAMTLAACVREGGVAGRSLAEALGFKVASDALPTAHDEDFAVRPFWHVTDSIQKAFVDFQNDVTAKDMMLAAREGFHSVEHLKRYTTLGMATDQGRTANVVGLAMMAALTGRSIPATGTTTYRPPYAP
ncbi:MAG TPA: hypothetical protein VN936_02355, partial [Candidatus Acidoferrum sp.]|nr:hypothetical protein [Candidatus Acidoferrum sp.]